MKTGAIIGVILALIAIAGIFIFMNYSGNKETISSGASGESIRVIASQDAGKINNLITITSSGFSPNRLEINAGESVTFINQDSNEHWPASDVHPTHTVYPGSDKKKCGTSEEKNIFDACKGLDNSEEYSFTFNEKGSWNYHDHLRPSLAGIIIVN